jgi:outer membrane autotransporter protein
MVWSLRDMLAISAAAGALTLAAQASALAGPDPCTASGTTLICAGDQSAGVALTVVGAPPAPLFTELQVNSTSAISKPSGNAIVFASFVDKATLTNNATISAAESGIIVIVTTLNDTKIENSGEITATRVGLEALGKGNVAVINSGNIIMEPGSLTHVFGINAISFGNSTDTLTVSQTGSITVTDQGSGIRASSLASSIEITQYDGDIAAGLNGGSAMFVSSSAGGSASITVKGGLTGGGSGGAGIYLSDERFGGAPANKVVIEATGSVSGFDIGSNAIFMSETGSLALENSGKVTGDVNLQNGGANSFDNKPGGIFNMGSVVYLGDSGGLRNAGTLSPGGSNSVATVQVTGNLVQPPGGTMLIDVDGDTNTADRINVTGTADLAGTVTVNIINPVSTRQKFTIVSAAGGATADSVTLAGGLPAEFLLFQLNANDVLLGLNIDFALDEYDLNLNRNQTALGENLNAVVDVGAGGVAPVINALLGISDPDQYRDALNQLLPEHYLNLQAATLFSAEDFAQSLISCRERDGAYAVVAEGRCLWVEADASRFDQNGTEEQVRTQEDSYRLAGGGQFGLTEQWHMGFALRYEKLEQYSGVSASSDGQRIHAGATLKFNRDPLLLAGAVSAGRTWYDTERDFGFGGFSNSASSSHNVDYVSSLLRAAYLLPLGDFHLKPIADLNFTHLSSDGFTEKDGGGAALEVAGADGTYFSFSPALEAGADWRLDSGTLLRPFISGGVTWYGDNDFTGTASFADAPEEAGSFVTRTEIDKVMDNVAAGVDILGANGFDLRLRYEGAFGQTIASQSLGLRAAMWF